MVGRPPEKINRNHGTRTQAKLASSVACGWHAARIEIEARHLDVSKHWNGADQSHNFRRRCEGKTRAHNRIAGTDAFSHEDQEQCVSAACASDGVCNATEASELALEQAYFGTEDKLAMPQNS